MTDSERQVLEEAARVAGDLSEAAAQDLARRVGFLATAPSKAEESVLLNAVAHGPARDAVADLVRHWRKQAVGLTPAAVAGASPGSRAASASSGMWPCMCRNSLSLHSAGGRISRANCTNESTSAGFVAGGGAGACVGGGGAGRGGGATKSGAVRAGRLGSK